MHMKGQFDAWMFQCQQGSPRPSADCVEFVKGYFKTKFWKDRWKLCSCFFASKPGGHRITSIPSEQEFSRLKRSAFGTRANMNIADSQDAIQLVEEQALNDVERDDWQALTKTYAGNIGSKMESLSLYLNDYCCTQLALQYGASKSYICCYQGSSTYLIRKKEAPKHNSSVTSKRRCRHILPMFWRTRTVKVCSEGKALCSCSFFANRGIPCRHFLALIEFLNVPLGANMCSPRYLKKFGTHYNVNQMFTTIVDDALQKLHKGIPLPLGYTIPTKAKKSDLDWFVEGKQNIISSDTPCYLPRMNILRSPTKNHGESRNTSVVDSVV